MKISFVIAVYQNAGAISATYEKLTALFRNELSAHTYEIVFVNDGSTDGSWEEILSKRAIDDSVIAVNFTRNFGQMAAMLAGFKTATGDAVINISADIQDPVDLIPKMVEKWQQGSETVICYRTDRADAFSAKLFSKVAYGLIRMSLPQIPAGGFDFVLMDRRVMDLFNSIDVRHRFFQGDLLWAGFNTTFIPYTRLKRTIGRSQYNFSKKLKNFLDAILDASYLPIRFISLVGFITAILGLLWAVSIVISWALGYTPFTGWAPIMMVILLLGGLNMIMLGLVGEYVWRINEEVRKRPNFVIREIV